MAMDKENNIKQFYPKDTSFANLMQKRIFNVLLVEKLLGGYL